MIATSSYVMLCNTRIYIYMGHWACREHGPALAAAHTQGTLLVDVDSERERMNNEQRNTKIVTHATTEWVRTIGMRQSPHTDAKQARTTDIHYW